MTRVGLAFILYLCVANLQAQQDICYLWATVAALGCGDGVCRAYIYDELARCENGEMMLPPAPPPPPSPPTPCGGPQRQARPGATVAGPRQQSSSGPPCAVLVDPVPLNYPNLTSPLEYQSLVNQAGTGLVTDPGLLATGGNPVMGIGADSAARLVVRLYANAPGDQLKVTLSGQGGGAFGRLKTLLPADNPQQGSQVTVTAVDTHTAGTMAFVQYLPPPDFSRGGSDDTAPSRVATIMVTELATGATYSTDVTIWRPPVVLVHGLWSGWTTWSNFNNTLFNPSNQFFTTRSDYSQSVGLTSALPNEYLGFQLAGAPASSLGFEYNAPTVLTAIRAGVDTFRQANQSAGVQADVVAHSMGGVITRTAVHLPSFADSQTFDVGPVHKLVTIGTPHLGSPLAVALLQPASSCIREILGFAANLVLASGMFADSSAPIDGAVFDLQGTAAGQPLSQPLIAITQGMFPGIPTAVLAGQAMPNNLSSLSGPTAAGLRAYCNSNPMVPADPLAASLTPTGWGANFAGFPMDGVVAVRSQLNNTSDDGNGSSGFVSYGILHSSALNLLGFSGTDELNDSYLASKVIYLLNYPLSTGGSSSYFKPLQ